MVSEERQMGLSDFGVLLRRYRLAAGLSQEDLAERAGLSANGIGALERGYRRAPQRETLALIVGGLALNDNERRQLEAAAARSKSPSQEGMTSASVQRRPDGAPAKLPLALDHFVGRENELEEIAQLVREHRLVTLTGAGGIGKTQTALRAAASLEEGRIGDVRFIGLAPLGDPVLVVSAIAASCGVKEVLHQPLLETVVASLRNHPLLLILDNCEHVVAEAAHVAEFLLSSCPELRILATSREPLRSAGEHMYRLPSLTHDDAVALFVARARAADHRFEIDDENAFAVGEICHRLDGIPLAIELAAARVNVLSLKALSERIGSRLQTIGSGARTAAPRQQTMAATIAWSYDLLSPQEQRVFERLSVFAGGCTLELAAPVCCDTEVVEDAVLDLLMSLVDKSLLVADLEREEPRYALLEPFRQYAREKLGARQDEQIVLQRQAKALLMLAEELERDFDIEADRVREALQEELDNWRAVLQWTLTERRDVPTGLALVGSLYLLWKLIPFEGRRWVTLARELGGDATPAVHVMLDYADGEIASALREYERQLSSAENALAAFRVLGDVLGMARAQSMKCAALINFRRYAEAKRLIRKTLALSKQAGDRHVLAYAYRCLAFIIGTDSPAARRCLVKAIQLYEAAHDRRANSTTLCELGGFEVNGGQPDAGLAHLEEALEIDRTRNDVSAVTRVLGELATNLIDVKRYGDAERYAREALDLARRHHLDFEIVLNLDYFVKIFVVQSTPLSSALDDYAAAARVLGYADSRLALIGSSRNEDVQADYESALTALRGVFDADRLAGLMAEGAAMSEEDAVQAALSAVTASR